MNKQTFAIPLIFLVLSIATNTNYVSCSDQVTITIQMEGDAYITITNSNGSITIIYNGVDIIKNLATKNEISSLRTKIYAINRKLGVLIAGLNESFNDLYGKVYFLAHVTGIYKGNDNSTVTLMLKSGNATLVDFMDQLFNITKQQSLLIRNLSLEVKANHQETNEKLNQAFQEIYNNRQYYEQELKILDKKIESFWNKTQNDFEITWERYNHLIGIANARIDGVTLTLWCVGFLNVVMVVLIAWISRWKAEKIKHQ